MKELRGSGLWAAEFIPRIKMCDRCFNQIPVKACTILLSIAIGVLGAAIVQCGSDLRPQPPNISWATNKTETMPSKQNKNDHVTTISSKNITKRMGSSPEQAAPLDLVILADDEPPVFKFGNANNGTAANNLSAHQLKRHSYNMTSSSGGGGLSIEMNRPVGQTTGNLTLIRSSVANQGNQTSSDPLETSDSYFSPYRMSPRYDAPSHSTAEEMDEASAESEDSDLASSLDSDGSYAIDGASSNLSEKKVVKELTKMLSKGMSGATDQVRVETLENLKRRQRERKALKDNRARLFEDILNTAISSHPDNVKNKKAKGKPKGLRGSSSNLKHSSSSPANSSSLGHFQSNADLDPELASDAETVLQHLHGLAAAIDASPTSSLGGGGGYTNSDALSPTPLSTSESEGEDSPSADMGSDSGESSENEERPKKSTTSSSDRPIVRQFKKIKNTISQRRKQLDQIKKLFNVELAINPKDGSLMSKPIQSSSTSSGGSGGGTKKKHQFHQVDQADDFYSPPDPYEGSSNKRARTSSASSSRGEKARELLTYLRENPEILASVMAELTVDADPSAKSANSRDETESPSPYHQSLSSLDHEDGHPSASSRRKMSQKRRRHQFQQSIDPEDILWAKPPKSRRLPASSSERSTRFSQDLDLPPTSRAQRLSDRSRYSSRKSYGSQTSASSSYAHPIKRRTAESLLLESLRERQLLNLARLDLVLAERAASNRTSYNSSSLNPPSRYLSHSMGNDTAGDSMDAYRRLSFDREEPRTQGFNSGGGNGQQTTTSRPPVSSNRTDDELTHHFMMVNPTYGGNDTIGRQLNGNEFINTFNSNPQIQQPIQRNPQQQQQQNIQPYQKPYPAPPSPQVHMMGVASNYSSAQPPQHNSIFNTNSLTSVNGNSPGHGHQQQPQFQSQGALKRFRDWRDVSQTELDRVSSPPNTNISFLPYDLSTGGTLASAMEAQSLKAPLFMNYRSGHLANSANSLQVNSGGGARQATHQLGPNQQILATQPRQISHSTNLDGMSNMGETSSQFMTRSSVAEPDLTTVKLSTYDDQIAKAKQQQQQQPSRRPSDLTNQSQAVGDEDDDPKRDDTDENTQMNAPEQPDDSNGSGPNAGTMSVNPQHADYFSSYKDEIATRKRSRTKHRQQQRDLHSDMESDDTGAMWA